MVRIVSFFHFTLFFSFMFGTLIVLPSVPAAQEQAQKDEDYGILRDGERGYELHMGTNDANFMVNPQYEQMTRQLLKLPPKFNYERFRALYALSRGYDPLGTDAMRELSRLAYVASNTEDPEETKVALKAYNDHIKIHLANISVVTMARNFAKDDRRFGNPNFFKRIQGELFKSVKQFGDGQSINTAFHVVTMDEEMLLMSSLGYKVRGTTPMHSGMLYINAHASEDVKTGRRYTVFVDITKPMSHLEKLKKKKEEFAPALRVR